MQTRASRTQGYGHFCMGLGCGLTALLHGEAPTSPAAGLDANAASEPNRTSRQSSSAGACFMPPP
jgi:hypothetical protein